MEPNVPNNIDFVLDAEECNCETKKGGKMCRYMHPWDQGFNKTCKFTLENCKFGNQCKYVQHPDYDSDSSFDPRKKEKEDMAIGNNHYTIKKENKTMDQKEENKKLHNNNRDDGGNNLYQMLHQIVNNNNEETNPNNDDDNNMDIFDNNCDGEESQGQSEYNNNSCLDSNSDDDICHDKKLQNDHDNRKKG